MWLTATGGWLPCSVHNEDFMNCYLCQQSWGGYVVNAVCAFVYLLTKVISLSALWLDSPVVQWEELINVWLWSGPGYGFWITFPLPSPLQNWAFQEIISIFYSHQTLFTELSKMTDADKEWMFYMCEAIQRTLRSRSVQKSRCRSCVTFGWGNQRSRG